MEDFQGMIDGTVEIPTDAAELAKLYELAVNGETNKEVEEEVEATSDTVAEAETVEEEKEPEGISTKDGKHTLPYSVLQAERQRAQELARRTEELERQIEELKSAPVAVDESPLALLDEEKLQELQEYFPDVYQSVLDQQQAVAANNAKLAQLERVERQRQAAAQERMAIEAQEAIDNNPILSHWQKHNPEIFDYCVEQDNLLRKDPGQSKLSLDQRFDKVAKMALVIYDNPVKQSEAVPVKPAAAAKQVTSLSEIKGGVPEQTEQQALESMSAAQIGEMLVKMTPDKRAEFMRSLG